MRELVKNPYLWLWLLTSGMFAVLFGRFILGDYGYVYTDIGSDTFKINYSLFQLFSDVFHGEVQGNYFLNVGLGMDLSSYLYQYLNPLNFFVVILPKYLLPWALLGITYVKLIIISMAGYRLFWKLLRHRGGSFVAALLWTFSSYVMLWGQHYGFCTSLALFTVFLNLVYAYAEDVEKSHNKILVLWITLMLFSNYYFLYMSGIAGAVFILVYLFWKKEPWKKILKKITGLAGMGILGIMIGGTCLVSTMAALGGSARAEELNMSGLSQMLLPFDKGLVVSSIGRMFSNNLFGVANDYTGALNYYEIAMLFTSSLFLIALWYLVLQKKFRFRVLVVTAVSVWMVLIPLSGKLLNMNPFSQRWTFLLCMLEAFAVGLFIREIQERENRRHCCLAVLLAAVTTGAAYILFVFGEREELFTFYQQYFFLFVGFLAVYGLLLFGKPWMDQKKSLFPLLLTAVLCGELILVNRPGFELRENPTRNQLAVENYNDGTKEALEALGDTSVYRVAKTFHSGSENDSIAQEYPGFSVYMTTNPKELIQLKETYGGTGVSSNFAYFGNEDYIRNSLWGMKYLITKEGEGISKQNYTPVYTYNGKVIYQNNNALPFGYFYDKEWEKEEILEMPELERTLAAAEGFYYTDEEKSDVAYGQATPRRENAVSLMNLDMEGINCKVEKTADGIYLSQFDADPYLVISQAGEQIGEEAIQLLTVEYELSEKAKELAVYYMLEGDESFRADQVFTFDLEPGTSSWTGLLPKDVIQLRLDPGENQSELVIRNIRIDSCKETNQAYEELKNAQVTNVEFEKDLYRASVENTTDQTRMMCVPLLYHTGWKAAVDGQETKIYNINNGLCGIEVPSGAGEVTMEYTSPCRVMGISLSAAGVAIYLMWIFIPYIWRKNIKKKKG